MPAANLTRIEAADRASVVSRPNYEIAFDLTGDGDTFLSDTTVRFDAVAGASTFIEAAARQIHSIELNGRPLEAAEAFDGTRITLTGLSEHNVLRVVSDSAYTNTGEGLHRFVDPVDDAVYLYTELAVAEANRVFAVFDQPDLKARFAFAITAPAEWTVIGNVGASAVRAVDGARIWTFPAGPVMSSYIVAVIAGPYASWESSATTGDGGEIPLGVFTRASLAEYAEPEIMFETVRRGIAYYEDSFGVPYPYEKYDQIFVPEYNWGAMENIGAVTFNESYLFRGKVPDARKEARATVVLHELSHMWFGNSVTMRWWNDLWLNESFATWASTAATATVTEFDEVWSSFTTVQKTDAAVQDQLPTTHPVVARIEDLQDVEVNFDKITYAKGASVLKQLVAWVGRDAFNRGVGAYLRAHANGNATLRDLLDELEITSGRELTEWSTLWLETAGVNTLSAEIQTDSDGLISSFDIRQTAAASQPALRPHRLAVGFYERGADGIQRVHRVEVDIDGELTAVSELLGRQRPALVLLNDDDLSYATIRFDENSLATIREGLGEITDPVARALVWGSLWDSTRHAELPASEFVRLVLAHLGSETRSSARSTALAQLELAIDRYVAPAHAGRIRGEAADALWQLGSDAEARSDAQFQLVRAFVRMATTPAQIGTVAALLDATRSLSGLEIDADLRWELIISLAANDVISDVEIAAFLTEDDTAQGRQRAATAVAARPDPAVKHAAWLAVTGDASLSNDIARATAAGWQRTASPALLEPEIPGYFALLQRVWAERGFTMASLIVSRLFPEAVVTEELAATTRDWLAVNDGPPALRRLVVERLAALERAIAVRAFDAAASGSHPADSQ